MFLWNADDADGSDIFSIDAALQ